jgi:hypothetical protein
MHENRFPSEDRLADIQIHAEPTEANSNQSQTFSSLPRQSMRPETRSRRLRLSIEPRQNEKRESTKSPSTVGLCPVHVLSPWYSLGLASYIRIAARARSDANSGRGVVRAAQRDGPEQGMITRSQIIHYDAPLRSQASFSFAYAFPTLEPLDQRTNKAKSTLTRGRATSNVAREAN